MDARPILVNVPELHKYEGRIFAIAHFKLKTGKGDEAAAMLAAIKRHADSDAEPDCLCYHVVRNGFNSDQLSVFEGYNLPAGATVHVSSEPFKVFVDSGLLVGYDVQYYDEVPAA